MSGIARKLMGVTKGGVAPPEGWNVSTATFVQDLLVTAQETQPWGLFFKPDGLKMYVIGAAGDDVNEYNLSTAWDISTTSFAQSFSVGAQDSAPIEVFFKSDGLQMYVLGLANDRVNQYSLGTAWDVSTASFVRNFSVTAQENTPYGMSFSVDGLKMYIIGIGGDDVNEYNLSTAWDISTASFVHSFSVNAQDGGASGVSFKYDGLKMYMVGIVKDRVFEYNLGTAWDVSTASFFQQSPDVANGQNPRCSFFRSDGLKMYTISSTTARVYEYDLTA